MRSIPPRPRVPRAATPVASGLRWSTARTRANPFPRRFEPKPSSTPFPAPSSPRSCCHETRVCRCRRGLPQRWTPFATGLRWSAPRTRAAARVYDASNRSPPRHRHRYRGRSVCPTARCVLPPQLRVEPANEASVAIDLRRSTPRTRANARVHDASSRSPPRRRYRHRGRAVRLAARHFVGAEARAPSKR